MTTYKSAGRVAVRATGPETTGPLDLKNVQHGHQLVANVTSKAITAKCAASAQIVGHGATGAATLDSASSEQTIAVLTGLSRQRMKACSLTNWQSSTKTTIQLSTTFTIRGGYKDRLNPTQPF